MSKIIANAIQAIGGSPITIPLQPGADGEFLIYQNGGLSSMESIAARAALGGTITGRGLPPTALTNGGLVFEMGTPAMAVSAGLRYFNLLTGEYFTLIGIDEANSFAAWEGSAGRLLTSGGEREFLNVTGTSTQTFDFIVPDGVFSICAVTVGAGAGGHPSWNNYAGNGGALAWRNDIPVTPGEMLTVEVGAGGALGNNGGRTVILRGSAVLFGAEGGRVNNTTRSTGISGVFAPHGIGQGGLGNRGSTMGGGGGAGGYGGVGGDGAYGNSPTPAAAGQMGGGGGGTGYDSSTYGFGGGGGTGIWGRGDSGLGGTFSGNSFSSQGGGGGGSFGTKGGHAHNSNESATLSRPNGVAVQTFTLWHGQGGFPGGGGANGGTSVSNQGRVCCGGGGAARIIWGLGRSFPSKAGLL